MATIKSQYGQSANVRIEAGEAVLAAAKTVTTKSIAAPLAAFTKAHKAYVAAAESAGKAERMWTAATQMIAEADVAQDASVDPLAVALISAGAPRATPFKGLSAISPSKLKQMSTEKEAKELAAVARKAAAKKDASKAVKSAAAAAQKATERVTAAIAACEPKQKAYRAALTTRDALALAWETAMAKLKRATRVAEDEGAKALFATLFVSTAGVVAPAKKSAAAKAKTAAKKKGEKPAA